MKYKPDFICFVPEKRKEITTEGGLNLDYNKHFLKKIITKLKKNGSRISLFIEPKIRDLKLAKFYFNADCVEIHTGKICRLINNKKNYQNEFRKIKKAIDFGVSIGLEIHAGHGITYKSAENLSKIAQVKEMNIGHFLIGEAIYYGLDTVITKMKNLINK